MDLDHRPELLTSACRDAGGEEAWTRLSSAVFSPRHSVRANNPQLQTRVGPLPTKASLVGISLVGNTTAIKDR